MAGWPTPNSLVMLLNGWGLKITCEKEMVPLQSAPLMLSPT